MRDSRMEALQVLQQPDAGTAVDDGDEELDLADAVFREIKEFTGDLGIIEVSISFADFRGPDLFSRMLFKLIIFTGIAAAQDVIDHLAALAAE